MRTGKHSRGRRWHRTAGQLAAAVAAGSLALTATAVQADAIFSYNGPGTGTLRGEPSGPYVIGNLVAVGATDQAITALGLQGINSSGVADGTFLTSSAKVGIWDSTGSTLLASADVTASDPLGDGGYRYHAIPEPVTLKAGSQYLIGAVVGGSLEYFYDYDPSRLDSFTFSANSGFSLVANTYGFTDGAGALYPPTNDAGGSLARWAPANALFVTPGVATWKPTGGGEWNSAGNWTTGSIPNGVDAAAAFTGVLTSNAAVNIDEDSSVTLGRLTLGPSAKRIVINGLGSLTMQSSTGNARITVANGSHVIQTRGITLASDTALDVAAGSQLALQSPLVLNGVAVTKQGDGALSIESYLTGTGSNSLSISAGTVTFRVPAGSLSVSTSGSGSVTFNTTQGSVAALNISAGSAVVASGTLTTSSLNVAAAGKLDVGANRVIVRGGNVADLEAQLAAGRNVAPGGIGDGSWDASHGIVSSAAAAAFTSDGIESKAVGLGISGSMPMGDPTVPGTSTPIFAGAADGDVLLRCTYNGDATLDGVVDDFDVIVVGALYDAGATSGHHWYEGDFNGDGKIDDSDVILLGAFYNPSAPVLSDSSLTQQYGAEFAKAFEAGRALAMPEPATLSILGVGAMGLLARRRCSC